MQSCNAVSPLCIKRHWKIDASIIQSKCCVTASVIHASKAIEPLPASSDALSVSSRSSFYFFFSFLTAARKQA
jgi:hypothetical protein